MITKKINGYWCGFCKKFGRSSGHMRRHEWHCTMNPARICRMCLRMQSVQVPIEELKALIPSSIPMNHSEFTDVYYYGENATPTLNQALKELRQAAEDCPMCILAAFRQSKIPLPLVTDFKFDQELKDRWAILNDIEREQRSYGY